MQNYFALAAPQLAGTGIDTSPLRNALNDYAQSQRQAKQDQIAAQDRQFNRERIAKEDKLALGERIANRALAADLLTDPIQRKAALDSIAKEHPDFANLPEPYKNPATAFKLIAADYGKFRDDLDRQYKQSQIESNLAQAVKYKSDANEPKSKFGLQVVTGQDVQGNPIPMVANNTGELVPMKMQEGIKYSPAYATEQKEQGKLQAKAKADLPRIVNTTGRMMSVLEKIENDPYLDNVTGIVGGNTPNFQTGSRRVQSLINQAKGNAFLAAFESLKGGGQITETEGQKATDAITTLNEQGVSKNDYVQAVRDLKEVLKNAVVKARVDAGELPLSALEKQYNTTLPDIEVNQSQPQNEQRISQFKYKGRVGQ